MNSITDFEDIIRNQFAEAETRILPVFRKYKYGNVLFNSFKFVHRAIRQSNLSQIPHSAGSSLTTINDFLRTVQNNNEKVILEELAAMLFIAQVEEIRSMSDGEECIRRVLEVMKTTCELKGYDYEVLCRKLNLDRILVRKLPWNNGTKSNGQVNGLSYYQWVGDPVEFDDLCKLLKDKGHIDNVRNFNKLFKPIKEVNFHICVSEEGLHALVFFISTLYKAGLIRVKGNKGYLATLIRHLCDLGQLPIKKEGKRILEKISRNSQLKTPLEKEAGKMLRINCKESMRLLSDLNQGRTQ